MGLEVLENDSVFLNCTCPICGAKFHLKPYAVTRFKTHYCSKKCQNEARKIYMRGEGNHQWGLRGDKNASWKGGKRITSHGYFAIYQPDHPFSVDDCVLEHRLIAERYLLNEQNAIEINGKRYLSPKYIVHHKNENRRDNRVENLEVMMLSDHQAMHAKKQSETMSRDKLGRFSGGKYDV